MPDPVTATGGFVSTFIGTLGKFFLVPFILFGIVLLVLGLAWLKWGRQTKRDSMKEVYKTMVETAKFNKQGGYDYMKHLRKMPFNPSDIINDDKKTLEEKERLLDYLKSLNTGVYVAEIVGYNKIDFLTTKDDLIKKIRDRDITDEKKAKLEKTIEDTIDACKGGLHIVVFKKKMGMFKSIELPLLVFDDQISGVDDFFGSVVVYGHGIQRFGDFCFMAGYPERVDAYFTYLEILSRYDATYMVISNVADLLEEGRKFDSNFLKTKEIITAMPRREQEKSTI